LSSFDIAFAVERDI